LTADVPTRLRRLAVVVAALLAVGACADDGDGDEADAAAPEPCAVFDGAPVEGCEVVGIALPAPLSLEELEALAADAGGEPVAVWRVDAACVDDVAGDGPSFPVEPGGQRASAFAYWHADEAVARQGEGPPATDGGWSLALRERFLQEWEAAGAPGVRFTGGALLLPRSASLVDGDGAFPVASYRTDEVGVLYLEGHEHALAPHLPAPDPGACQSS
jgi:hypothetical protein